MYIYTKEGPGQNQETWSAPKALNGVKVQSAPPSHLGGVNGWFGQPKGESCKYSYRVYFEPDKDWTSTKKIGEIADKIVSLMKIKKKGSMGDLRLKIHVTGYFDMTTDSWRSEKYLDDRRAANVHRDLIEQLHTKIKEAKLVVGDPAFTHSGKGPAPPVSKNPAENRRAEICIRALDVISLPSRK